MILAKIRKAKEQSSLFEILERQQGVTALLPYQVWTVSPLQRKKHRDRQLPNIFLKRLTFVGRFC